MIEMKAQGAVNAVRGDLLKPTGRGPAGRLGLLYAALACLIAFAGAAWWSWRYAPLPDPFEPAESQTWWQWLTTPIERNAFRRLPVVTGDLNGVFALKGTDHVWAVGDGGLILHSADGGESWEQQSDIDWNPAAPKQTEPAAENDAFGLIRSAYAGERPLFGPPNNDIHNVQRLLRELGYDSGPADGRRGAKTRAAIEQFQRDAKLPVDGKPTEALRERLQKESAAQKTGQLNQGPSNKPLEPLNPNQKPPTSPGSAVTPPATNPGVAAPPIVGDPGDPRLPVDTDPGPPSPPPGGPGGGSPSPRGEGLAAVAFVNERLGIAVGDQGVILRTLDGGARWRRVTSSTDAALSSVAFADAKRAVVVGDGGTLLRSTNGGERWETRTSGIETLLESVAFADRTRAVAVGDGGTVLRSTDGGDSWERKQGGTDVMLTSVAFATEERAVAVGKGGTVLVSTDGGEHWRQQTSGTKAPLLSVAFANAERALAVGTGGTVLLSTDGGEHWQPKTSGTEAGLSSVAFATAERALAVGYPGTVLVSTNGGETWQLKTTGAPRGLISVAFANAERALAVGEGGTVLLSTDGGESWQPKTSGTEAGLSSVAFATAERALAVGYGGTVLLSTDGGESWRPVEYRRYPAPLFLALSGAALLFGLAGARRAWREVPVESRTASVTDLFASDRPLRPGERDALDLGAIARGISRFLRNRQTEPPLTIAVTGEWGSGKSSLMGLLYDDLRGRGFRPVWFNAWHHQRGEHLLASLYANIRAQALPPAWTPEGLGFHWDLFWIRARRHWLWLVLAVLLVSLVVSYLYFHLDSTRFLIDFAGKDSKELWDEIGKTTLLGGGLLAAAAPALIGLRNGLRAFGLDPKRLLGALGGGQEGMLKAEPGVRYRFAAEFADATKALKPQTLVIFIDDLDRCTQEHVLEVLECINFLVTAGDCYVVLGMSRRWVETCVGLAFKELAAESPEEPPRSDADEPAHGQPGHQASPSGVQPDDARDERRHFARQYLEKLINIEVPIPRVGDAAAVSLLVPPRPEEPTRRVRAARWLRAKASQWWLPVLLVTIAAGAVGLATMLPDLRVEESKQEEAPIPDSRDKKQASAGAKERPEVGGMPKPEPPEPGEWVRFSAGARDESAPIYHWGSAAVAALALLTLIGVLLGRRGRVQTDDSEDFRAALEIMRPWIVLGHPTPRLLKRYLNHVRFVAMRQRGDEEPGSLAESLLQRLGFVPQSSARPALAAGLAEPLLVGLSALHQSRPDWQTEPEWLIDANLRYGGITEIVNARVEDAGKRDEVIARLQLALEDYNRRFSDHRLFTGERRDRQAIGVFIEAMAGVRIDGKVEEPAAPA